MEELPSPVQSSLGLTLGAQELGIFVSVFLFGIATVQAYSYYETFPRDRWLLKTLVAVVWLLGFGHTVCDSMAIYTMTIRDFGKPSKLLKYPSSFLVTIMISGCTAFLVQIFLALRVLNVSGKTMPGFAIAITCWMLSTTLLALSVATCAEAILATNVFDYGREWAWIITAALSTAAAADIIIAAALSYYLVRKKAGALESTAKLLDKLIVWTMQTGLITSMSALLTVICFKTMPDTFIWIAVFTFASRMYANSFISLLNGRYKLRCSERLSNDRSLARASRFPESVRFASPINISVETSHHSDVKLSPTCVKSHAAVF